MNTNIWIQPPPIYVRPRSLAEAAAAKDQAEFEQLLAEKESEKIKRDAEHEF